MKLLLEAEVAAILRCSRERVKRLRLDGKLRYIPGRPVFIDEADLMDWIERAKTRVGQHNEPQGETSEQARAWVIANAMKSRRKPRNPAKGKV